VLVGDDGARVGELAARLGGGHDAELCRAVLGVALNGLAIAAALGQETPATALAPTARAGGGCVRFLVAPPGELVDVEGLDEAFGLEGIRGIRLYRKKGFPFGPLLRGADRAGAILALGDDRDDALARADRAAELIQFRTTGAEALAQRT
jgi:biotin carboxylase